VTDIQRSADCGNSPKNKAAEDLAVGLETGQLDGSLLADGFRWRGGDGERAASPEEAEALLRKRPAPASLTIDNVTSHGKVAAVSGTAIHAGRNEQFAHFIRFTSASAKQVAEIESFRKLER
jgi:hypothetical protein